MNNSEHNDLEVAWRAIESSIPHPRRSTEYQLEWGARREAFYESNGGTIPLSEAESQRLQGLHNRFLGERIFILGNGPSLNRTPLHLLENEYTFVTNRAYLLLDRLTWRPTFYTALDWRVVPDVAHEINQLAGIMCFFEKRFQNILRDGSDVFWYTHGPAQRPEDKVFAYNLHEGVRGAGSVIGACVQISFYLGFREIYLLGCDLGYKVNDSVRQEGEDRFGNGVKLYLTSTRDDDPNHFDPRYFGTNRRWHDPNVKRMISGHEQCLKGVVQGGGKIFNATVGGELEVYPRADIFKLLPGRERATSPRETVMKSISDVCPISPVPHSGNTAIGPMLRCEHAHFDETDVIWELINFQPGFMIDVGAHRGTSCLPFLGSGWTVQAFEPDQTNRNALIRAVESKGFQDRIRIDTRAVGSESRQGVRYYRSDVSSGISGLSAFHESHVEAQQVDIVTLAEYFLNMPLPKVDFLKIDTEGHDLFVLQGFPWERCMPVVIECEFENIKTVPLGYTFQDLARFLVDKGYTVYVSEWHPIIRYGIRHDWRQLMRYPCELADPKGWGNLLAFRDPIDEQALIAAVQKVLKVGGGDTAQKPAAQPKPAAPARPAVALSVSGANIGFRFEPGEHFASIAPNQWRFNDAEAKQKLWGAAMDAPGPTAGRSFVGSLRLMADRAMTVNVSLGRQGKSEYEGTTKRVLLTPGIPQTPKLERHFNLAHKALKLQIEVLALPGGGSAVLTIDRLRISECLASVRERIGVENLKLVTANRLFREGNFGSALAIYLALSQQHPLQMYRDNAVMAAKKAGMTWVEDADQLA